MSKAETEIAWAAGFFDGEGTTFPLHAKYKSKTYPTIRMAVAQAGDHALPLLERFQAAVGGIGKIYGPLQSPSCQGQWKPKWLWTVQGIIRCQAVYSQFWHILGPAKRQQILVAVQPTLAHIRKVKG